MADGSSKPIGQVKIGDQVQATDPETGRTTVQRVTATFVHTDEGDMTELTVTSPSGQTGMINATRWHPVYDDDQDAFVPVGDLRVGAHLHSTDGSHPVVTQVRHYTHYQPVYDLTVDTVHTYNLLLRDTTTLVHNCGDGAAQSAFPDRHYPAPSTANRFPMSSILIPSLGRGAAEAGKTIRRLVNSMEMARQ